MLFIKEIVKQEDINNVNELLSEYDNDAQTSSEEDTNVTKYISSLVSGCYQKSIEDIENTHIGNKITRRRNFQQIMQQSFFYGANRFGNNFIA